MENLLEHLNKEQVKAVTHREGPLMIIAGAGTGKTTVITHRIGWLIEQKLAAPENILALTFTEKAAAEMEERVDILLPYGYVDLPISTFHAFCERVLRDWGAEIGLSRDFLLVNELDAWLLARQHLDRFALDYYRPLGNPTKHMKSLLAHFSRAKDELVEPDDYLAYAEREMANRDGAQADQDPQTEGMRLRELAGAYHTYQQILLEHDALDFGDLVLYALRLIEKRPRVLTALREQFRYILVDEFQDTNWAQYELVKRLAAPNHNLTVVGDDDQSIYKFRGASLSNILQFESDYPTCTKVVLTKNYRSGQKILDQAYTFIQRNNPNRLEGRAMSSETTLSKRLTSERGLEGTVEHLHFATLEEETRGVCEKILALKERYPDASWSDVGILVRANRAAQAFVEACEHASIPYQFMALRGLYVKPVVVDILAILRVIDRPYDSPSLYRVLSHPMEGIPPHELVTLTHEAKRKGKTLYEICRQARSVSGLSERVVSSIETLLARIEKLTQDAKTRTASEMMLLAAQETGLMEYVNHHPEARKQNDFHFLRQFYERVKRFEDRKDDRCLHAFLEEFAHERDAGEEGSLSLDPEAGPDLVRIMTVHSAKGLEFRFVFVVNMVDRRFPTSERREAIELPDALVKEIVPAGDLHLEEERRLFYVAMTRAKDALFFTSAETYGGARKKKPSRFLVELNIAPSVHRSKTAEESLLVEPAHPPTEEPIHELPKQFSFTQLRAFSMCPLQYKFAHILKIPVFESWTLSFGKTMHHTLQEWFRLIMERTGKVQQGLFSSMTSEETSAMPSVDEILKIFREKWIDDWYPDDRTREEYRKKGRESLTTYHRILTEHPPRPRAIEQGFTCKIGSVTIKGRMDRIDDEEDGVEIIDYKTGAPKQKLEGDDKEQLLLYQIAAEEVLGLKPVKLTYHYLDDHSQQSFIGSREEISALKENVLDVVNRMKTSRFEAMPGFWCRFCDFRDICEFRQDG